jgi:hypothetical protein
MLTPPPNRREYADSAHLANDRFHDLGALRPDDAYGDRAIAWDHARSRRRLASEFFALHHSDRDGARVLGLDQFGSQPKRRQSAEFTPNQRLAEAVGRTYLGRLNYHGVG